MTDGHTAEEVVCALALRHRSSEYWAAENHCLTAKWSQIYCVFLSAELACSACSSAEVLWRYYNLVVCLFGSMNKPPSGNVVSVLTLQQETPRHNHVINIWLCCQKLAVSSLIPRPKSEWVSEWVPLSWHDFGESVFSWSILPSEQLCLWENISSSETHICAVRRLLLHWSRSVTDGVRGGQ